MKTRFLFFLLLFCSACFRSKPPVVTDAYEPEIFTEDSVDYYPIRDNKISVNLNNPQKASLFDYFERIELIPLETRNDVLIGPVEKIVYYQNRFYVLDERPQYSIHVFDETGNFIFKIAKRGRGPGEYILPYDFVINPFTGHIDLLDAFNGRVVSYDLQGNHVKTSERFTDSDLRVVHSLIAISENKYVFNSGTYQYRIIYFDMDEQIIFHHEYEENVAMYTVQNNNPFYEYRGQWYFYRVFDNYTYLVGTESLEKAYTWDFGRHSYDVRKVEFLESRSLMDRVEDAKRRFPYWMSFQGQNNRYVMAQIRLGDDHGNVMYDKSMHESKFVEEFDELVSFRPYAVTNKFVFNYCYHGALDDYVTEDMLDESNRKKVENLKDIRREQNPVIIKYNFK